jgi:copper homeostasis protein
LGAAGASGFVLGVLDGHAGIDIPAVAELVDAAGSRPVTFHRAFDAVQDRLRALERLEASGVRRVLTSGGAATAWEGRDELRRLVGAGCPGITILAGGRVRGDHVRELVTRTGVREVHARASGVAGVCQALQATG